MDYDQLSSLMLLDEQDFLDLTPFLSETNYTYNELPIIPSLDASSLSENLSLVPLQPSLEDIDLDSLTWDDNINVLPCYELDVVAQYPMPLNIIPNDIKACGMDEDKIIKKSTTDSVIRSRSKIRDQIGYSELKKYFYMPIASAAKEMNVGLTVLKKRCRELGIARWPHRKMKSLNSLIHNVKEIGKDEGDEIIGRELKTLEEEQRLMEENPEMDMNERTKKLRQACFKANYKKRKAMQSPCNIYHHPDHTLLFY